MPFAIFYANRRDRWCSMTARIKILKNCFAERYELAFAEFIKLEKKNTLQLCILFIYITIKENFICSFVKTCL